MPPPNVSADDILCRVTILLGIVILTVILNVPSELHHGFRPVTPVENHPFMHDDAFLESVDSDILKQFLILCLRHNRKLIGDWMRLRYNLWHNFLLFLFRLTLRLPRINREIYSIANQFGEFA